MRNIQLSARGQYVLSRIAVTVPLLLGVSVLAFAIVNVLPGNTAERMLGLEATPEQLARLEEALNLNRPALERYLDWLGGLFSGDLGRSLANQQPVADLLLRRLPVTLELVTFAILLALGLAIPTALLSARWPNSALDRLSAMVSMTGLSVASYVLALVLVLIFAVKLALLPSIGFAPPSEGIWRNIRSLILPATALAIPLFSLYTRFLRGDLLEQLQGQQYIVAARAKGLGPWRVLVNHALRNSLLGLLTLVSLNFAPLIGGTVIIEQLFGLPGLGQLLLQGIHFRDVVIVQAVVLMLTVVTVLGNLLVDLVYAVIDPRIHHA